MELTTNAASLGSPLPVSSLEQDLAAFQMQVHLALDALQGIVDRLAVAAQRVGDALVAQTLQIHVWF